MTASLERELEARARQGHARRGAQAPRAGAPRAARSRARARAVARRARDQAAGRVDLSLARRAGRARGQPGRGGRDAAQAAARGQGEGREAQPPAQAGVAVRRAAARSRRRRVGVRRRSWSSCRATAMRCGGSRRRSRRAARPPRASSSRSSSSTRSAAATPAEKMPLLHRLAALYEKRGDAAAAAERLERAVKLDKNDLKALEALGRLDEQLEQAGPRRRRRSSARCRGAAGPRGRRAVEALRPHRRRQARRRHARGARRGRRCIERRPTDKEALEGLTRLARARGDWALLDDVLAAAAGARRRRRGGGGGARARAARRRAARRIRSGAIEILRHVLDELAPRNLEAHARLQKLLAAQRRPRRQLAHRRARAVPDRGPGAEAVDRHRHRAAQLDAAQGRAAGDRGLASAWPSSAPTHAEALERAGGAVPRRSRTGRRCCASTRSGSSWPRRRGRAPSRCQLLRELAATAEEQAAPIAKRAFEYLRLAHELGRDDPALLGRAAQGGRAARAVGRDVRGLRDLPGLESRLAGGRDRRRAAARSQARLRGGARRRSSSTRTASAPARARAAERARQGSAGRCSTSTSS